MRYFKKMYPQQPLILSSGRGFSFAATASGLGVHATENPKLLKDFDLAIEKKIGGISEITQADYDEIKKKSSPQDFREHLNPSKILQLKLSADRAAAALAANADSKASAPLIARSFKKPASKAGTSLLGNPNAYRPGTVDRK